jgi:hypothetical protein
MTRAGALFLLWHAGITPLRSISLSDFFHTHAATSPRLVAKSPPVVDRGRAREAPPLRPGVFLV